MSRGSSGNEPKGLRKMFQKMLMPAIDVGNFIAYSHFFIHHEPVGCELKTTFLFYFLKTQHI